MHEIQPLVRLPVAPHLVQPEQQPDEPIQESAYHIDGPGLLKQIDEAAEEGQHHQVQQAEPENP